MKTFTLKQRVTRDELGINYLMEADKDGHYVYLTKSTSVIYKPMLIAHGIAETKRGWIFETRLLTSKRLKVFLPREDYNYEVVL